MTKSFDEVGNGGSERMNRADIVLIQDTKEPFDTGPLPEAKGNVQQGETPSLVGK